MKIILRLSIVLLIMFFLVSCDDGREKTYTIAFETNGGTEISSLYVTSLEEIELTEPSKSGFTFLGWYEDENYEVLFNLDTFELKNVTLYAKWSQNEVQGHPLFELFDEIKFYDTVKYTVTSDDVAVVHYEKGSSYTYLDVGGYEAENYYGVEIHQIVIKDNSSYTLYTASHLHEGKFYSNPTLKSSFDYLLMFYNVVLEIVIFEDMNMDWFEHLEDEYILKDTYLETFGELYLDVKVDETLEDVVYKITPTGLIFSFKKDGVIETKTIEHRSAPSFDISIETVEKKFVQGVTDTSIKVGHMLPTSGVMATAGYAYQMGITAYFDYINQQGGVHGRTIDLISYEQDYDKDNSLSSLRKLLTKDQVFALVGHQHGPDGESERKLIAELYLPLVGYTRIQEEVDPNLMDFNIFPTEPLYHREGRIILEMIKEHTFDDEIGDAKVGIIYSNSPYENALKESLEMYLGENAEVQLLPEDTIGDIINAVNHLKSAQVEAVIVLTNLAVFETTLSVLSGSNLHKDVYTTSRNNSFLSESIYLPFNVYANGWFNIYEDYAQTTPSSDFELFNQVMTSTQNESYMNNPFTMQGYQAAYVFVEGLKRHTTSELTFYTYINTLSEGFTDIPFAGTYKYYFKHHSLALFKYDAPSNRFYQIAEDVMPLD